MKKGIIIGLLIASILFWITAAIYLSIQKDQTMFEDEAVAFFKQSHPDASIEYIERFHGDDLYYVITATNEDGEYFAFISESLTEILTLSKNDIAVSRDDVTQMAFAQFNEVEEVIRVVPAFVNQFYAWEVVGVDEDEGLQYIYYRMRNGEFIKRYKLSAIDG